jgi:hypothetical protein
MRHFCYRIMQWHYAMGLVLQVKPLYTRFIQDHACRVSTKTQTGRYIWYDLLIVYITNAQIFICLVRFDLSLFIYWPNYWSSMFKVYFYNMLYLQNQAHNVIAWFCNKNGALLRMYRSIYIYLRNFHFYLHWFILRI